MNVGRSDIDRDPLGGQSQLLVAQSRPDAVRRLAHFRPERADHREHGQAVAHVRLHADRDGLLDWLSGFEQKPRQVFVVHGDDEVATGFAMRLGEEGYTAMAPFSGTRYDLANGKFIEITRGVPLSKAARARIVSDSYTKLKIMTKRLQDLVEESTGLPNKDLDKFTKDLEKLMEKYRR